MNSTGADAHAAEMSVIGSAFLDPECLDEISFLEPRDFASKRHELIYKVLLWLYDNDKPVDLVTVVEHFKSRGRLEDLGGTSAVSYLTDLISSVPSSSSVTYYAKLVRSQAIRRRGAALGEKIKNLQYADFDSDEDYFSEIESMVDELRPQKVAEMQSFVEMEPDYQKHLSSKAEKILSGFRQFDKWSSLWRGWLYVLAGRPGVGKTAYALQMAIGIARQRREIDMIERNMKDAGVVLFFSQEMGKNELIDRMISNLSGISYNRINDKGGNEGFTDDERIRINKAYEHLKSLQIYIMDKSAITIEEVRAIARRFKKRHGKIAAIFVDYLQIMNIPQKKNETRDHAIGKVTGTAKQIARQLNCVFVLLSQMNRDSENSEEPKLSHLKESGSIEQDADVVHFLHHDPDDTETGGKVIQSIIAKGRNVGVNRFRLLFMGWLQRFKELEKKEVTRDDNSKRKWSAKNRK